MKSEGKVARANDGLNLWECIKEVMGDGGERTYHGVEAQVLRRWPRLRERKPNLLHQVRRACQGMERRGILKVVSRRAAVTAGRWGRQSCADVPVFRLERETGYRRAPSHIALAEAWR